MWSISLKGNPWLKSRRRMGMIAVLGGNPYHAHGSLAAADSIWRYGLIQ